MDNHETLCVGCSHEQGEHFTTHNGRKQGCAGVEIIKNVHSGHVDVKLCDCDGFGYECEELPE